jgi:iron complex outermembrane receptor protein
VVSGFEAPLLPFIGADYWLIKRNETRLKIKISVSKNYRIPTLNDRYWQNAGDLNLLPETSYALEGCWQWRRKNFELSNAWFAQQVNDWIQWVPSENGNFTPQNVRQVMAKGFEVKASNSFNIGVLKLIPIISYQLTSTVTTKAGDNEQYIINKQLIYTPTHTSAAYVQWSFKTFQGDVSVQYNSMRFTDFGNSEVYGLPAFALVNASVGKQWHFHNHQLDFRLMVRNLFNADYQLYSARAMPGRNFSFQFNYQLYH